MKKSKKNLESDTQRSYNFSLSLDKYKPQTATNMNTKEINLV
jgi:hypothetical protein